MTRYLFGAAIFVVSLIAATQPPINAHLARRVDAVHAATISFAVGTLALLIITVLTGHPSFTGVRAASPWEFTGGLIGAMFVYATIILIPRLGAGGLIAGTVAGQLAGGVLIDQLGLFGVPQSSVSPLRVLGIVLLMAGAILVIRK